MDRFPNIDEVHEILDNIAEEIPKEFYRELNYGIVLHASEKLHPESSLDYPLYILGEYGVGAMGRHIGIYYGSFKKMYSGMEIDFIKERLRETLIHEFTHHLESLAGEKDLEVEDKIQLEEYRDKYL